MSALASVERELRAAVAADIVAPTAAYLTDMTEARGLSGRADAVALPRTVEEVAEVVAWCYAHGVAIVPRGGGTGYAGGAVPLDGGVVLSLERLDRVRSFDPLLWRIEVEAGLRTAELRRIAREGGLLFAPDPGAAEQSQIGANIATNAGGRVAGDRILRRRPRRCRGDRARTRHRAAGCRTGVHRFGSDAVREREFS